ncbi:MAG TPA: hypothetical protein VGC98_12080 [Thermoleophilaceae bacterium]|jgi:hypothetical protein
MTELVPIAAGIVLGLVAGSVWPAWRVSTIALLSVVLGTAASAVTGELDLSWTYVLVDIPEVALSATVAFVLARMLPVRPWLTSR